jgi:glycosyltransferase involved in cell wall biosynthesis
VIVQSERVSLGSRTQRKKGKASLSSSQVNPPIRVLLIAPSIDILGGQAIQAIHLMTRLGTEPEVRMAFQPINPRIGFLRRIRFVRTAATFALYFFSVAARSSRYDIIHIYSAAYYGYLLWTLPALLFAKLYRKKIILNYHDGQAEDHLRNWRTALPTIRRFDRVITPSGFLVDVFARFDIHARSIFNVLEPSEFIYRARSRLRPVFLHNRILEPLYNIECTLRAFKIIQERFPEASLTLAHDGPSRPHLEAFARQLALRNTTFVGRVPPKLVPALYDANDIYLTSPDFDCMPGSILECFASGLPVIATNTGGIPYIADNEKTALLIPRGDHEAMAAAAFRLLDDEELVVRLTANALEACKRYAPVASQKQWLALYKEIMNRAPSTEP